jgi:hypothetical protein
MIIEKIMSRLQIKSELMKWIIGAAIINLTILLILLGLFQLFGFLKNAESLMRVIALAFITGIIATVIFIKKNDHKTGKTMSFVDERFILHRLKSTRWAAIVGVCLMALWLITKFNWVLIVIMASMAVAKWIAMFYYKKHN